MGTRVKTFVGSHDDTSFTGTDNVGLTVLEERINSWAQHAGVKILSASIASYNFTEGETYCWVAIVVYEV